jgi:hypothetical protein
MVDNSNVNLAELQKQVEYYLSDSNLKQDEFFYNALNDSATKSIGFELLLNCNKIKKLKATKDDIIKALESSGAIEVLPDQSGIKRKNDALPEFEPKVGKKVKKNDNGHEESKGEDDGFEELILKITISKEDEAVKWETVRGEIEKVYGVKVPYVRLNRLEGHACLNKNEVKSDVKTKIVTEGLKMGDVDVKLEECKGKDLQFFFKDHGRHLDSCLERTGLKAKKKKADRSNPEFIFMNQRYYNISKLRNIFRDILTKTGDDDKVPEPDHSMLLELLKYHDKFEEKSEDLDHFTAGQHPEYKQTRCFMVVKKDGSKKDWSSTKCLDNIKKKFNLTD